MERCAPSRKIAHVARGLRCPSLGPRRQEATVSYAGRMTTPQRSHLPSLEAQVPTSLRSRLLVRASVHTLSWMQPMPTRPIMKHRGLTPCFFALRIMDRYRLSKALQRKYLYVDLSFTSTQSPLSPNAVNASLVLLKAHLTHANPPDHD